MKTSILLLAMASVTCLLVAPAGAEILYWDFEEPLFVYGMLDGQQGWASPNTPDENYVADDR